MHNEFVILVADRNRHVREFLRRELQKEGYHVEAAKDGQEVLRMICGPQPPDLLILDLDLPYVDGFAILENIREKEISLPVVVHTFLTDYPNHHDWQRVAAGFVEKCEDTDNLKAMISDALQEFYPYRFVSAGRQIREE
jgi:CheY-like chemotaxis protein